MQILDEFTREEINEIEERYKNELEAHNIDEKTCTMQDIILSDCKLFAKSIFALKYLITKIPRRGNKTTTIDFNR